MRKRTSILALIVVLAGVIVIVAASRRGGSRPVTAPAGASVTSLAPSADLPAEFQNTPAGQQGRVVRTDYRIRRDERTVAKHAYVYLPAGYDQQDEQTRYDILYLMHGAGMTTESFFGGTGQSTGLKNVLDHMIEQRQIRPTIVVTPSFYPDGNASLDLHYAGQLDREFPRELITGLMPAVEGAYHTYAATTDAAGFTASRAHRAFGGFSMGAVTTWYVFIENLDYFRYFLPMAGDCWVVQDYGGTSEPAPRTAAALDQVVRESGYERDDFLIAASVGSSDGTTYQMDPQISEMRKLTRSFDDGNLRYAKDPGGGHDLESMTKQFYNAIQLFF
ncbi:alpha/beta hydrolase [Actinoplanes sp. CA-131856]